MAYLAGRVCGYRTSGGRTQNIVSTVCARSMETPRETNFGWLWAWRSAFRLSRSQGNHPVRGRRSYCCALSQDLGYVQYRFVTHRWFVRLFFPTPGLQTHVHEPLMCQSTGKHCTDRESCYIGGKALIWVGTWRRMAGSVWTLPEFKSGMRSSF